MKSVKWVLAVGLAAGAALSGIALAAGGDAKIEATQFTVDHDQTGGGLAQCGRGERALGGGVVQSGPADGLLVWASGPLDASGFSGNTNDGDKPKQWYAAAGNFSGADDRAFRVFAICASHSKATIEATRFTADYRQTTEEFAKCGPGERALGGGVVQSGPPDYLFLEASGPLDASGSTADTRDGDKPKQWYAAVYNADDPGRVLKVFAICAPHSKATIEATRFTVDHDQTGEANAKCGRGERALGGGVVPSGPADGLSVRASGPLDASGVTVNTKDGDTAKQWYAAVANGTTGDDRVSRVLAICSRGE